MTKTRSRFSRPSAWLLALLSLACMFSPFGSVRAFAQGYVNSYDFSAHTTTASAVSANTAIAGLIDLAGNRLSVSSSSMQFPVSNDSNFWQGVVYDPNSNTQLNQRVRVRVLANSPTGFSYGLFTRMHLLDRQPMYQLGFYDNGGTIRLFCDVVQDGTGQDTKLLVDAPSWYNSAHSYIMEFKSEGTLPTVLTVTFTDESTSSVAYTTTFSDSNNGTGVAPLQSLGYAGIISPNLSAAGGKGAWSTNLFTVDLQAATPALIVAIPTIVSRTSGQNNIAIGITGGTPPYSVQYYRSLTDWAFTPVSGNAIGSPVTVSSSGLSASYSDSASILPGKYYIYRAVATDSSPTPKVVQSDYLFVEGLRGNPGALPSISTAAQIGVILATWGDSITAPGIIATGIKNYLVSNGVTVTRMANAGWQGSRWIDWTTTATNPYLGYTIQEGAVDTNTNATYASEFDPTNALSSGNQIPGVNSLQKAEAITDREIAIAGSGKLLVIDLFLGMNDLLQGVATSDSVTAAQNLIAAIHTKYPAALIVINHTSYGFPGGTGPVSPSYVTTAQATWVGISALANGTNVFVGDESAFYATYANAISSVLYPMADQPGWYEGVITGTGATAEHVHVNAAGDSVIVSNSSAQFGQGPALLRSAISYSTGPPAPTVTSVSISPGASISQATPITFGVFVTGTRNPDPSGVWSASIGTITPSGVWTPPAGTIGVAQTATITYTTFISNFAGTATVTIPAIPVPDMFAGVAVPLDAPVSFLFSVTTGSFFPAVSRVLYAGAACTVSLIDAKGNTVTGVPLSYGANNIRAQKIINVSPGGTALFGGY